MYSGEYTYKAVAKVGTEMANAPTANADFGAALEEYNHMNMKTVDNVKLYQVKDNKPILEKEKGL